MTKNEIQDAANIARIQKLRAMGHQFELYTARAPKCLVAVFVRAWHKNDTSKHMPTLFYCAKFHGQSYAEAYIKQMEAAV